MYQRSKNLFHKRVGLTEVRLDARAVMDEVGKFSQQAVYNLSFRLIGDRIVPSSLAPPSGTQGSFLIEMNWPNEKTGCARGLVWIKHEHLLRTGQILVVTGEATKAGGRIWTFACPLTKKQVQVLYLHLDSERFVSRQAIQRRLPPIWPRTRGLLRAWMKAWLTKEAYVLDRRTKQGRDIIEVFDATIELAKRRFYYRESNLPRAAVLGVGVASYIATFRRSRTRANPDWPYYRDKAGALRIKAKFKKSFGLLGRISDKSAARRKR